MFFLSDIDSSNYGRGRDRKKRKSKGSMAFTGAAAGGALGTAIPLGLATLQYKKTGSFNRKALENRSFIGGLAGAGVGGVLGETVWNKKLGLQGTDFTDSVWDRKGKFWNKSKRN